MTSNPSTAQEHTLILESSTILSPTTRNLTFQSLDGQIYFKAGQYGLVTIDVKGEHVTRPFTIASSPDDDKIDICVTKKPDGTLSIALHDLPVGAAIRFKAPLGRFFLQEPIRQPLIFFATGAGVAPMRSMIKRAIHLGTEEDMHLVFGVRTEQDILFKDEWNGLMQHHSFHLLVTLSRPDDSWEGERGYIQAKAEKFRDLNHAQAYICGQHKMVVEMNEILKRLGFTDIHSERYD